jgi:chromosome segregation ATPase
MMDNGERLQAVEQRLERVETGLKEVREEVGGLRTEVGGLRGEVGELHTEVGGLRGEVNGLRISCEKNADDIKKIAEIQVHHGQKLDKLANAIEPLVELRDLLKALASNHEQRIETLERHTGLLE